MKTLFMRCVSRSGGVGLRWVHILPSTVVAASLVFTVMLAGCGGGKKNSPASSAAASSLTAGATGRAKLTIKWPARSSSRLVPDLSQSILVEVLRGADRQVFDSQIVPRPADVSVPSIVTFDSLPVETLVLRASAHPNADGTGTAQSASETPLVIANGQETNFGTLTMGTTIDTITVAPPANGGTVLAGSAPQNWTATPKDAAGNIILVSPDKQSWESSDTKVATVDPKTGVVTPGGAGVGGGTTTIKETDTESGKSGTATLTVVPVGSIVVTIPTVSAAAKSVVVTAGSATKLLPRVNGETSLTTTFASQTAGSYAVTATAYATTDGTGVAVSKGSATASIAAGGGDVSVTVPLISEISSLIVSPTSSVIALNTTQQFTVKAVNVTGTTVPTVVSQFSWASDAPAKVSIDPASGLAKANALGSATITVSESESGKSASAKATVTPVPTPQFNPNDASYAGATTVTDGSGGWTATGDAYQFDTGASPPTLTDTTTKTLVATGKLMTQSFGTDRTSVTYAVFDFPKDITINKSAITATGANPLIVLTQGSFSLMGSASITVTAGTLGGGITIGSGAAAGAGPGAGQVAKVGNINVYGGGSFGGLGGGSTLGTYGSDFPNHLQGGSCSAPLVTSGTIKISEAGGGALYVGAVGSITVTNASITANGFGLSGGLVTGFAITNGGGGSGGGIALWGGGGVSFSSAALSASGGSVSGYSMKTSLGGISTSSVDGYGGGGGYVVVGYGPGTSAPSLASVSVSGGAFSGPLPGGPGNPGVATAVSFAGF